MSFFHLGDAWEEGDGAIRFDACIEANPMFGMEVAVELIAGRYHQAPVPVLAMIALHQDGRATLDPTDVSAEFPAATPGAPGRRAATPCTPACMATATPSPAASPCSTGARA